MTVGCRGRRPACRARSWPRPAPGMCGSTRRAPARRARGRAARATARARGAPARPGIVQFRAARARTNGDAAGATSKPAGAAAMNRRSRAARSPAQREVDRPAEPRAQGARHRDLDPQRAVQETLDRETEQAGALPAPATAARRSLVAPQPDDRRGARSGRQQERAPGEAHRRGLSAAPEPARACADQRGLRDTRRAPLPASGPAGAR